MTERPILLNAEMVRAVLDGRKTQTRRIIQSPAKNMQATGQKVIDYREPGDKWYGEHVFSMRNQSGTWCDYTKEQFLAKCPFGSVGDRLWVRETFNGFWLDDDVIQEIKDGISKASELCSYRADYPDGSQAFEGWTPSIHMPRWASRITLEITGVRVERLTALSDDDARSEGCPTQLPHNLDDEHQARTWLRGLWSEIYGEDSWQANPWVWVIEFKRVEGE